MSNHPLGWPSPWQHYKPLRRPAITFTLLNRHRPVLPVGESSGAWLIISSPSVHHQPPVNHQFTSSVPINQALSHPPRLAKILAPYKLGRLQPAPSRAAQLWPDVDSTQLELRLESADGELLQATVEWWRLTRGEMVVLMVVFMMVFMVLMVLMVA